MHAIALAMAIVLGAGAARAADDIDLVVDGNRVTLDVGTVPLADVLRAIGDAGGFDVKIEGDLGEVQSQRLRNLPMPRAIKRLSGDHGLIMQYGPDGRALRAVRVHAASSIGASPEEREAARKRAAERRQAVLARAAASTPAAPAPPDRRGGPLADLSQSERFARLRELSRQGDAASLPELGDVLRDDPDPALRRAAAAAIANIGGPEAADALEDALDDEERTVRIQALRALRSADQESANDAFADVLASDPDPAVRRAAVELAAGLGAAGEDLLEMALDDEDEAVVRAAESALRRIR